MPQVFRTNWVETHTMGWDRGPLIDTAYPCIMSSADIGNIVIALVTIGLGFLFAKLGERAHRDQIFAGITPGQVPLPGDPVPVVPVSGKAKEYADDVAVQFTPPAGVRPGMSGTIIDGSADMRDVTATIVDLAVRGFLRIEVAGGPEQVDPRGKPKRDWVLHQILPPPTTPLEPMEAMLLSSLFAAGPQQHMSQLSPTFASSMHQMQAELSAETVRRGWYEKDPRYEDRGPWPMFVTLLGIVGGGFIALQATPVAVISGLAMLASMIWARGKVARRIPRTALGTAARIQTLGFKKYLETAEADQIRFEEAADIFSRYLPYAIAFGVAEHWAKTFGEVAARAQAAGYVGDGFAFTWLDAWFLGSMIDSTFDGLLLGDAFGAGDFSFVDSIGELGSGLGDMSGDFASGIGDAISGIGDSLPDFDIDFDF
jgi:hypothetical protein